METQNSQDILANNLLKADKIANETNDYNLKRAIKEIKENSGTMYKDDVEKAGQNFEDDDIIGSDYTCDLPKKLLKIEKGWKSKK